MKVLVFTHPLYVGGAQVNSIELSASLRDVYGYDIVLFGTPGPMVKLIEAKGLRLIPVRDSCVRPAPVRMQAIRDAVQRERPDLVHAWDWPQYLDAYYPVHLLMRIPMLVTDMEMDITRLLPKWLPLTFGTPELRDRAKVTGRKRAEVLLPPVDIHMNAPDAVNPQPFRERYGIKNGDITLVTVSRLERRLKGESLFRTIDAVRTLRNLPLRFVVVGDGDVRVELERFADEVNADLGRPAVVFTGALLDARPAYAAADIVVGMGGSALRGMAFGKPVIVVGEQNVSAVLTPESAESFYYKGIYGRGNSIAADPTSLMADLSARRPLREKVARTVVGNARLINDIDGLAAQPDLRLALGQFSRQFVVERFSLQTVSGALAEIYRTAIADMPPFPLAALDAFRTAAVYLRERKFLWRWSSVPTFSVGGAAQGTDWM
jgi:glycosyltransferase involved in cell wall biosynthesis